MLTFFMVDHACYYLEQTARTTNPFTTVRQEPLFYESLYNGMWWRECESKSNVWIWNNNNNNS